jgi:hydrogenase-4 component B
MGLVGAGASMTTMSSVSLQTAWFLPWGQFAVAIDALSAFFLMPVFVVPALGAIYGLGYWRQTEHPDNGRKLGLFYGLLAAGMALVVIARDGVLFLIAWEIMAIAAYFASTADERNADVRRAGWVYLVATHTGTLVLIAMFSMWRDVTGSFSLCETASMPTGSADVLFVLAIVGFGFKAGLMPLHVWLPGAHANAPSHVSAVMSGVMLKMGIYGMVRMTAILPMPQAWWGGALLAVGAITGIAGIAFAMCQHDIKRVLAYSSVENIGIIAMGLGLALLGRSQGRIDWMLLGLGGALLHVWNHAMFKSLLFLAAGAIIHAVDTREMDRLGALARSMPRVMIVFVLGAVAICALPPMNGFVSEWLLYLGLFRTLGIGATSALAVPVAATAAVALAVIGAMALACFVKLFGTVFLGSSRSDAGRHAHDPCVSMMAPMAVLAVGCVAMGILPSVAMGVLDTTVRAWAGGSIEPTVSIASLVPMGWISVMAMVLIAMLGVAAGIAVVVARRASVQKLGTWDCGYAMPTSRIQYTGSSFVQMLASLFSCVAWPKVHEPQIGGAMPRTSQFKSTMPDTVLDRLVIPMFCFAGKHLPRLRVLQQGQTQYYVLYVLVTVIVLWLWGVVGA